MEKKRKVIIRLYRQFDIDLLYAFKELKNEGIVLQDWITKAIRTYIAGNQVPDRTGSIYATLLNTNRGISLTLSRKQQFHIVLDETEDSDILNWLDTITIGYRNTVIKGILRWYIGKPCVYPCLASTDLYFRGVDAEDVVKLLNDGLKRGGSYHV